MSETRRQIQQMARELDEVIGLYSIIVDNAPFGIAVHDGHKFRFINAAGARILGGEPADIINKPIWNFVRPRPNNADEMKAWDVMETSEDASFTTQQIIRLDGKPTEVSVLGAPVSLSDKPHIQIIVLNDLKHTQMGI